MALARSARERGRLERVAHISTAFVSGKRNGLIREDELDCGQSFSNTYEQTKFEAEVFIRKSCPDLPWVVFRPSIIVGDSRTGYNWTRYITTSASGRPDVFLEPRGSNRVPAMVDLGLRLEKNFDLSPRYRLGLMVDIFNALNRGTELQVDSRVDSLNFGKATWVVDPRSFRLSLRFIF